MEVVSNSKGGGGGGGGGEVRSVNVVYFLSRNGRVEHPHLFRIHRLGRDRVHLRDVKRWLSEFRGKDMPDSFAWSYKRRYRGGYIWQDLTDDDLITPFSDNEYVLKGSEIPNDQSMITPDEQLLSPGNEKATTTAPAEAGAETLQIVSPRRDPISPEPPPVPDRDSSGASKESSKERAIFRMDAWEMQGNRKAKGEELDKIRAAASLVGSNNHSKRATQVLCNILRCKSAVQTKDDALRPISRQEGKEQSDGGDDASREGRMRNGGKGLRKAGKQEAAAPALYATPTCSQCGMAFKPQKLNSHMKSCKGLTGKGK